MVKLKVPLYLGGRMIPAGEEVSLPQALENALLLAGNAGPVSADPLPSMPEPPAVDEAAPEDEDSPEQAEEIPPEPEKPPRRYGR